MLLLRQILVDRNSEVFANLEKRLLPKELHDLYDYLKQLSFLPSLEELLIMTERHELYHTVLSLTELDDIDTDIEFLLDRSKDIYAQNKFLDLISINVDKIPLLSELQIVELSSSIALELQEDIGINSNNIGSLNDLSFEDKEAIALGLNPIFDSETGVLKSQMTLIGAQIGVGKSHVAVSCACAQYRQGKPSIIFSLEMSSEEMFSRILANLSGVNSINILKNKLTPREKDRVALTLSDIYQNSGEAYSKYQKLKDLNIFRDSGLQVKPNFPVVNLGAVSVSNIDLAITKQKLIHGNNLEVIIVDYLNRISGTTEVFDWKNQAAISADLKDLATKHNIHLLTFAQAKEGGELKLSKDILIPVDWSWYLDIDNDIATFSPKKVRSGLLSSFATYIDRDTSELLDNVDQKLNVRVDNEETDDLPF